MVFDVLIAGVVVGRIPSTLRVYLWSCFGRIDRTKLASVMALFHLVADWRYPSIPGGAE